MGKEDEGVLAGFGSTTQPGDTRRSLLEGARRGDREGLERLCRLYGRLIWKVYLADVPEQDREDVFQEVFRTVIGKIRGFHKADHDGPAFRAWLRRIAYHKVGNYRGRRGGLTVSDSVLDGMGLGDDGANGDGEPPPPDERTELVLAAFEEAAANFAPRTVEAVRRLVFRAEPPSAVAADLGMTHNALHIAKSRFLARVRKILEMDLGEPMASTMNGDALAD